MNSMKNSKILLVIRIEN